MDEKNCSLSINRFENKDEGNWSCMVYYNNSEGFSLVSEKRFQSKIDHSLVWTCPMPADGEKLQACSWRIGDVGVFKSAFKKSHEGDPRIT